MSTSGGGATKIHRADRPASRPHRVVSPIFAGPAKIGGEGGIRTLGTLASTHDFQSCTFDHSVTSPGPSWTRGLRARYVAEGQVEEKGGVRVKGFMAGVFVGRGFRSGYRCQ
jgi:hypothetical protein